MSEDHVDNKLRIRPFSHGDLTKVISAAGLDGHGVLRPTHVVEKGGKVVGAIELNSVPIINVWMHTKDCTVRDTLRVKDFFENMAQGKMFILPCSSDSPYAPYLEKHAGDEGYLCLGDFKLYIKKEQ